MIAIISDIHANHPALMAVLSEIDKMCIETIVCLGDVGGYYCDINECCQLLREREIFSLMGNHDWYLATGEPCPRSNSVNRCIRYQSAIIQREHLDWLRTLKPSAEREGIALAHGGWKDPLDEYVVPSTSYFSSLPGTHFASGHTHVPCTWTDETNCYCNPGSVGQPRDGDPRASFATWDGTAFTIKRVDYDYVQLQTKMKRAGFEPYFYENLSIGSRLGGKIDSLDLHL